MFPIWYIVISFVCFRLFCTTSPPNNRDIYQYLFCICKKEPSILQYFFILKNITFKIISLQQNDIFYLNVIKIIILTHKVKKIIN
jgi:hypothetical protein